MKKILGLDLGVGSIGWAIINETETQRKIVDLGSRIIPYQGPEGDEFLKGTGESKNHLRTTKRTARKLHDRYQMRRKILKLELEKNGMMPTEKEYNLNALDLYEIRSNATKQKISLNELGRILLLLNQKRGYKHGTMSNDGDKKQTDFVSEINNRFAQIKGIKTIGTYFYNQVKEAQNTNKTCRLKEQIFPREAYIEEFNIIWNEQQQHYSDVLTTDLKIHLRDNIIFYQRKLKSQKDLVSICEFEGKYYKTKENKEIFSGPKVAQRTNPLFQIAKIWESVNNITVKRFVPAENIFEEIDISEFKNEIVEILNETDKISEKELFTIIKLNKKDGYYTDEKIKKSGIQGNKTYIDLKKALEEEDNYNQYLKFDIKIIAIEKEANKETGELNEIISPDFINEPLYKLWHICYSIKDLEEKKNALKKNYPFSEETIEKLTKIDFVTPGYGNKSIKSIRRILPSLMNGKVYSKAMELANYNHSFSENKEVKSTREIFEKIDLLKKNSLRQPIVEKILNQLINLVNSLQDKYNIIEENGKKTVTPFDEIRIELARELKMSKDERNDYSNNMNQRTQQNKKIADRLLEYKVRANRKNIEKWRLWHEVNGKCLYCNSQISVKDFLEGVESDVEHIIPRSLLFDDSFANKTISHTKCNKEKGNMTAHDYMRRKGGDFLKNYLYNLEQLTLNDKNLKAKTDESAHCVSGKISKTKFNRLMTSYEDYIARKQSGKTTEEDINIWETFISRQLNETRYISRKAVEILSKICRNVTTSGGTVTASLRELWGWEDVIMNLQIPKYREHGLTVVDEFEHNGQNFKREKIPGWSKRDDHRHHAVDALVVACTQQGFIQRINTLNAQFSDKEKDIKIENSEYKGRLSKLEKYLISLKPFNTHEVEEAVSKILISFKPGKKVATTTNHKYKKTGFVQKGIIVPRGALSAESVMGKITTHFDAKTQKTIPQKLEYLFENPDLIFKPYIKTLVLERLSAFGNDSKKALSSLVKDPIYLDKDKKVMLEWATCIQKETVLKYPLSSINAKDVPYIVDKKVRELVKERLEKHGNNEKEAFKTDLYFNEEKGIKIRSVRFFTKSNAVVGLKKNEKGDYDGYVNPDNNHHIALYKNKGGELVESVATFWHCVERKKFFNLYFTKEERDRFLTKGVIIKNPTELWILIENKKDIILPEEFKKSLPEYGWKFVESLQQNEMFIIGLNIAELESIVSQEKYSTLAKYVYRVQKISSKDYLFKIHTEVKSENNLKVLNNFHRIQSLKKWNKMNPIKIEVNNLGKIKLISS